MTAREHVEFVAEQLEKQIIAEQKGEAPISDWKAKAATIEQSLRDFFDEEYDPEPRCEELNCFELAEPGCDGMCEEHHVEYLLSMRADADNDNLWSEEVEDDYEDWEEDEDEDE